MLGPIALPRLPSATATAVLWPGRWPPASASIVSLAPCSSVSTDRCCCTSLLRVPLYERQDSAAALQSLLRACVTTYVAVQRDGLLEPYAALLASASSCPWLDARARRRCRSSRRPAAVASRTRTRPPASTVAVASAASRCGRGRHLSAGIAVTAWSRRENAWLRSVAMK